MGFGQDLINRFRGQLRDYLLYLGLLLLVLDTSNSIAVVCTFTFNESDVIDIFSPIAISQISVDELDIDIDLCFTTSDHSAASMNLDDVVKRGSIGKSLRLQVDDMSIAERAEVNLCNLQNVVGQEATIIEYMRFSPDFSLHNYDIDYNWLGVFAIGLQEPPWQPYFEFHVYQRDLSVQVFDIGLVTRNRDGDLTILQRINDYPLPLGEWFEWKVFVNRTTGVLSWWIQGNLVYSGVGLDFARDIYPVWKCTVAKLYGNKHEPESLSVWIDDIKLYNSALTMPSPPVLSGIVFFVFLIDLFFFRVHILVWFV